MFYNEFVEELKKKNYTIHESSLGNLVTIDTPTHYKLKVKNNSTLLDEMNNPIMKIDYIYVLNLLENMSRE